MELEALLLTISRTIGDLYSDYTLSFIGPQVFLKHKPSNNIIRAYRASGELDLVKIMADVLEYDNARNKENSK